MKFRWFFMLKILARILSGWLMVIALEAVNIF